MKDIFNNFTSEINNLRNHIIYMENVKLSINNTDPLYNYVSSLEKRRFDYKSLIISLYGIIEYFSEKFLITYLEKISEIVVNYINLNEKIRKNHVHNSAQLILKVLEKKHNKFENIAIEEVVSNLNRCLNTSGKYTINYQSFTLNSGNLKHSKICDLFKQVNINIDSELSKCDHFHHVTSANKFQKVDDIVLRRNEIAHGTSNDIIDLLNTSQITDYIDFIEIYFTCIYKSLENAINKEKFLQLNPRPIKLVKFKVFPRLSVVGFYDAFDKNFEISDLIIIKDNTDNFTFVKILEVKNVENTTDVTLKLELDSNYKLKSRLKFYLCKTA